MAVTDTMGFPLRVVGWIGGASLRSSVAAVNSARRPTLAANLRRQLYFQTSRRSTSSQGPCAVKPGIHPAHHRATVQRACGHSLATRSTAPVIHVEVCAKCHPYFTGKQKLLDTAGRVERFRQKYGTKAGAS